MINLLLHRATNLRVAGHRTYLAITMVLLLSAATTAAEPAKVVDLWAKEIPGPAAMTDGPEADKQKTSDRLVGGKTVMKLGNVAVPQMHIYPAPQDKANGAACVICPGGGFSILAWDLEGTEVAQWLNSIGVTAVVLKYRVPTRSHGSPGKWQGPVMDAQRALSLVRSQADELKIDTVRVGILGFSAGGETAAMTAAHCGRRLYDRIDAADEHPCDADFAILIYPGGIIDQDGELQPEYAVQKNTPPMFFAHAADDRVTCRASAELFLALNAAKIPAELHIYPSGGHGYGLRPDEHRVTRWPSDAAAFLREQGFLSGQEN